MSPQIHIVGGFLGSGKTTAIAAAAKQLLSQGKSVGVVTNDQGKYLVDTAFFEFSKLPTVEVTGGCFCCNYDDLEARLSNLTEMAQPDVIFAESVGSCADIVATVVKPLLNLSKSGLKPTSFTVFVDGRLLNLRLHDHLMPFSENVTYIFDKQLEEAGMIVINKADLLDKTAVTNLLSLAQNQFPGKQIKLQNSREDASVAQWLNLLAVQIALPQVSLEIDYQRYGAGEVELAWLDEEITLQVPTGKGREIVVNLLSDIQTAVRNQNWPIGHLKFIVQDSQSETKVSFTTLSNGDWQSDIPELVGIEVRLLLNARVETQADKLHKIVQEVFHEYGNSGEIRVETTQAARFHPGLPQPVHRL